MGFSFSASPVLKWAGGKQSIADRLVDFFPKTFDRFFEPFVGGGSVLLTLMPEKSVIGDMNEWLLDTYEAIRQDFKAVARILDGMQNTKEEFIRIRKICPSSLDLFRRAAHLVYLNKTCFRGLFRVNRSGQFNVPYGEYERRYYDPQNFLATHHALQSAEIRRGDFELTLYDVTPADFVYLDPPYYKLGGYSDFNRYTKDQFRENDQIRLAALCRELDERGVRWAISNSNTEFIRKLFDGYRTVKIQNRREINLKSQNRDVVELLVMNYT